MSLKTMVSIRAVTLVVSLGFGVYAHGQDPAPRGIPSRPAGGRETLQGAWTTKVDGRSLVHGHCAFSYGRPEWRVAAMETLKTSKSKRWRLGKDDWTTFESNTPLKIGGVELDGGSYLVVLEYSAEPVVASLVFLSPSTAKSRRWDASRAGETEGGVVVPLSVDEGATPQSPLTFAFSVDANDPKRLDLSIAFGPYRFGVPIVKEGGGFASVEAFSLNDSIGFGPGGTDPFGRRFGKKRNAQSEGYSPRAQAAVDAGLEWLKTHQSSNGSWDADGFMNNGDKKVGPLCDGPGRPHFDVGVSGLALLAFLGTGTTHRLGAHKECVRNGLRWLAAQQDAEGCFGPRTHQYTYNHAIATLAMAEAWGLTRAGVWKSPAQKGVDFAMAAQNPYRAWRYDVKSGDNDVSVTGWMAMALRSAKLAGGLVVPDDPMRNAHDFIEDMTDRDTGRTGYTKRGERPVRPEGKAIAFPAEESESLTAIGLLIRIYNGEKPQDSAMLKAGAELLSKRPPVFDTSRGMIDMYYWYFGTLAMFQVGGDQWKQWNARMEDVAVKAQRTDGNFSGSWDPADAWGEDGGRVYSTAMMTMCLEVYYRYDRVFSDR